jgi:hypothetical protein
MVIELREVPYLPMTPVNSFSIVLCCFMEPMNPVNSCLIPNCCSTDHDYIEIENAEVVRDCVSQLFGLCDIVQPSQPKLLVVQTEVLRNMTYLYRICLVILSSDTWFPPRSKGKQQNPKDSVCL